MAKFHLAHSVQCTLTYLVFPLENIRWSRSIGWHLRGYAFLQRKTHKMISSLPPGIFLGMPTVQQVQRQRKPRRPLPPHTIPGLERYGRGASSTPWVCAVILRCSKSPTLNAWACLVATKERERMKVPKRHTEEKYAENQQRWGIYFWWWLHSGWWNGRKLQQMFKACQCQHTLLFNDVFMQTAFVVPTSNPYLNGMPPCYQATFPHWESSFFSF